MHFPTKQSCLILILLLGLILRIVYLTQFKDTAFFNPGLMDKHDQLTFHLGARQVQNHPWTVNGEAFYMAPLYSYFLAVLYAVSNTNVFDVVLFQLLMDVLVCFFLYQIGRRLYDERVGLVAAFLGCFYRTFIIYAATILSDALITFLYVSFILLLYWSLQKPNLGRWVAAGVVLGLAALAKPTIGLYLPFVLIGLYLYPADNLFSFPLKRPWQPVAAVAMLVGCAGLMILPVTLRNWFVSGQFVPICTNGPINWAIGNSVDSIGLFCYPKGALLHPASLAFWQQQGNKLMLFFTSYEWPQNLSVYMLDYLIPSLKAGFVRFGFVAPVGLAGLALMCLNWRKNFLFVSFTLVNILWVVLFFVTDRYRLPAVAGLMVCAGYAIVWTWDKLRAKALVGPAITWVGIGAFAYFFNTTPGPLVPDVYLRIFTQLSKRNVVQDMSDGNLQKALKEAMAYTQALPRDPEAYFLLGCVYEQYGVSGEAVAALRKTLELNPDHEMARKFLNELTNR